VDKDALEIDLVVTLVQGLWIGPGHGVVYSLTLRTKYSFPTSCSAYKHWSRFCLRSIEYTRVVMMMSFSNSGQT
jgi:hypothetical protein